MNKQMTNKKKRKTFNYNEFFVWNKISIIKIIIYMFVIK